MGFTPKIPETPDVVMWQRNTTNGRIPRGDLEEITPPQYDPDLQDHAVLYPPAARAMSDLLAAAKDAGHAIRVKYSYRTLSVQQNKWEDFQNGGNLAAPPGTSNHGEALAVDLTDLSDADVGWLRNHAATFRFDNGDIASDREPWHWTYRGGYEPKEDDVGFQEFKQGVKAANQGDELPEDADPDFAFGYRMETRGTSEPKPAAAGPHEHTVKVLGRTFTTSEPV